MHWKILTQKYVDFLDLCQLRQVSAQDVALQREVGELAVTDDLNQACGLQLFQVMGKGGGAYVLKFMQRAACHWGIVALPDGLKNLITARLRQRPRDAGKLPVCKPAIFGSRHRLKIKPLLI